MKNSVKTVVLGGFLLVLVGGCANPQKTSVIEMRQTEENHQRLVTAVPPPRLTDSQERRNLVARLNLLNDPNRVSYIYLMTQNGQVVAYHTVKGKVSSLNSYLTTPSQVILSPGCYEGNRGTCTNEVVESPDFDGSYGDNPDGIFFFDTQNVYHEWNGIYLISDQPQRLRVEPILVAPAE